MIESNVTWWLRGDAEQRGSSSPGYLDLWAQVSMHAMPCQTTGIGLVSATRHQIQYNTF